MNTSKLPRIYILIISVFLVLSGYSQQLPTGGYQGGTHGNIKYTIWTGADDNDWANPDNWCPAIIPNADADVVVPSTATVMPEVKSEGLSCKSLNLEPGAEVIVKDGFVLTVNGQEVE